MPDTEELTTGVTGSTQASAAPQFATAEYAHTPGTERCRICSGAIAGQYYRVNNQMACAQCGAQAAQGQPTDSHAAFARGLLMGLGGAVLGMALYATVVIVTGWSIGYLGLAVGWLVGTAIIKGSNGMGGRRYQAAAVVLTYLAISMSYVPVIISYLVKAGRTDINWSALAGRLALWGVASPFLKLKYGFSGVMGLVILFVGLSIASRLTAAKPLSVDGPFNVTA